MINPNRTIKIKGVVISADSSTVLIQIHKKGAATRMKYMCETGERFYQGDYVTGDVKYSIAFDEYMVVRLGKMRKQGMRVA